MVIDDLFCVVHAAVTDLDCVSVEYFAELVVFRKAFVYQCEEFLSDVGADVFTERWVVPNYVVPFSVSSYFYG